MDLLDLLAIHYFIHICVDRPLKVAIVSSSHKLVTCNKSIIFNPYTVTV